MAGGVEVGAGLDWIILANHRFILMNEKSKSLDVLGVKPIADSVNMVTKGAVEGASAFLSRICLPAAEEFGFLLKDKVSSWRAANAVAVANKANLLLAEQLGSYVLHAHPRIVYSTMENGSWADDDYMQSLWAGLLASSCTPEGNDESNLIFIGLLSQLTSSQGQMINYLCEQSTKHKSKGGWIGASELQIEATELVELSGIFDLHRLDRELDHLRALDLIDGGFEPSSTLAHLCPTPLCLQLYVRSQGYIGSPVEFFGVNEESELA